MLKKPRPILFSNNQDGKCTIGFFDLNLQFVDLQSVINFRCSLLKCNKMFEINSFSKWNSQTFFAKNRLHYQMILIRSSSLANQLQSKIWLTHVSDMSICATFQMQLVLTMSTCSCEAVCWHTIVHAHTCLRRKKPLLNQKIFFTPSV